jgi:hypothetical protein
MISVSHGVVAPGVISTIEMYPQASLSSSTNAFVARPDTKSVTLTIAPVKAAVPAPRGYVFDGNTYLFTATAKGRPLRIARGASVRIALRGTGKKGTASTALYSASHWAVLPSPPSGVTATYSALVPSLGYATLVVPSVEAFAKPRPGPFVSDRVIVIVATVGVLTGMLLLIRIGRGDGEASA